MQQTFRSTKRPDDALEWDIPSDFQIDDSAFDCFTTANACDDDMIDAPEDAFLEADFMTNFNWPDSDLTSSIGTSCPSLSSNGSPPLERRSPCVDTAAPHSPAHAHSPTLVPATPVHSQPAAQPLCAPHNTAAETPVASPLQSDVQLRAGGSPATSTSSAYEPQVVAQAVLSAAGLIDPNQDNEIMLSRAQNVIQTLSQQVSALSQLSSSLFKMGDRPVQATAPPAPLDLNTPLSLQAPPPPQMSQMQSSKMSSQLLRSLAHTHAQMRVPQSAPMTARPQPVIAGALPSSSAAPALVQMPVRASTLMTAPAPQAPLRALSGAPSVLPAAQQLAAMSPGLWSMRGRPNVLQGVQPPAMALCLTTPMEAQWYADRPLPAFTVALVNANDTSQVLTHVSGWKVRVSMVDGFGQDASEKLSSNMHQHTFMLSQGTASISTLRFCSVSSKAGGFFRLVLTVVFPQTASSVPQLTSHKIQVLSYRLYHSPKVPLDKLTPADSVAKMRGIGHLYSRRFANLGIQRIEELARLDVRQLGQGGAKRLLELLRKDRGALTLAKLNEYVQQAQGIVQRYEARQARQQMTAVAAQQTSGAGGMASAMPTQAAPPMPVAYVAAPQMG